jgi:hypothetical protein
METRAASAVRRGSGQINEATRRRLAVAMRYWKTNEVSTRAELKVSEGAVACVKRFTRKSRDGGTGRRSGLKIRRGQPRGGSTPPPGTKILKELEDKMVSFGERPFCLVAVLVAVGFLSLGA